MIIYNKLIFNLRGNNKFFKVFEKVNYFWALTSGVASATYCPSFSVEECQIHIEFLCHSHYMHNIEIENREENENLK